MKVFFNSSPRTADMSLVRLVFEMLSNLGCVHTTDLVLEYNADTFYSASDDIWKKRYKKMIGGIAEADVCIFECSVYSLAIGQLVQESINREKPVIVLHSKEFKPYLLRGTAEAEKRVMIIEYDKNNLKEILKYALSEAKELLTIRFTMLLTPEYTRHLDMINKNKGISRSDYIRNLIKADIKKGEK